MVELAWTNDWQVFVNGVDVSNDLRPLLLSVNVTDKDGTASDTCSIEVDDEDGQFHLPNEQSKISARLNGVPVFDGTVDRVRCRGSRGGGRTLSISAKGYDTKGKAKEPQACHMDDATLKDFLSMTAKSAGFSIKVDPELGEIKRDYWAADYESFLHLGQRLAREMNATFKLKGKQAVFAKRGQDTLPPIVGTSPGNVISYDIAPLSGRAIHKKGMSRYLDRESASFKEVVQDFSTQRPAETTNVVKTAATDEAQAKDLNAGRKGENERNGGEGTVVLDAEPNAQAEAPFTLVGARPGVDGSYRIVSVNHSASRSSGTTTRLELKQPAGDAGTDSR